MKISKALQSTLQQHFGRESQNRIPQGLTRHSLCHHYELVPLFAIMGGGFIFLMTMLLRSAMRSTDVSWSKKPEPYNAYRSKQYKLFNYAGADYSKLGTEIPNYKDEKN